MWQCRISQQSQSAQLQSWTSPSSSTILWTSPSKSSDTGVRKWWKSCCCVGYYDYMYIYIYIIVQLFLLKLIPIALSGSSRPWSFANLTQKQVLFHLSISLDSLASKPDRRCERRVVTESIKWPANAVTFHLSSWSHAVIWLHGAFILSTSVAKCFEPPGRSAVTIFRSIGRKKPSRHTCPGHHARSWTMDLHSSINVGRSPKGAIPCKGTCVYHHLCMFSKLVHFKKLGNEDSQRSAETSPIRCAVPQRWEIARDSGCARCCTIPRNSWSWTCQLEGIKSRKKWFLTSKQLYWNMGVMWTPHPLLLQHQNPGFAQEVMKNEWKRNEDERSPCTTNRYHQHPHSLCLLDLSINLHWSIVKFDETRSFDPGYILACHIFPSGVIPKPSRKRLVPHCHIGGVRPPTQVTTSPSTPTKAEATTVTWPGQWLPCRDVIFRSCKPAKVLELGSHAMYLRTPPSRLSCKLLGGWSVTNDARCKAMWIWRARAGMCMLFSVQSQAKQLINSWKVKDVQRITTNSHHQVALQVSGHPSQHRHHKQHRSAQNVDRWPDQNIDHRSQQKCQKYPIMSFQRL